MVMFRNSKNIMPSSGRLRPLGDLESFFAWANAEFGAFTISAVVRLSGYLDVEKLRRAVTNVVAADQLLSSSIVASGSRTPCFQQFGNSPPKVDVLLRRSDADWQAVLQENVNRPFTYVDGICRSLFDMAILPGIGQHELVFRIHHSICDGKGLVTLLDRIMGDYDRQQKSSADYHPAALEVAKPVCGRIGNRHRLAATMQLLRSTAVDALRGGATGALKCQGPEADYEGPTVVTCLSMTEQETAVFLKACRLHQTTVNAAIAAASLQAAAETWHPPEKLSIQTNLDLRPRLGILSGVETVSMSSFWLSTRHAPGRANSFWDLAREYRHEVSTKLQSSAVPPLGFTLLAKRFLRLSARSKQRGRTSDLMLSNLGVIPVQSAESALRVDEFYFATSQSGIGSRIGVTAATVQSKLCLTCLTLAPDAQTKGQMFLSDLQRRLLRESAGVEVPSVALG
ncbi:MAG: hypothetical protein DWH78_08140 [Planctomycetota bacterium]|nr:MAG: hypothetical protein DWH78_08140 [Planctomycetota bacterium]